MEVRFGDVARTARVKARVSLRDLASRLQWSPVYVSDIERGTRNPPSAEKAREWAEAVGADGDEFVSLSLMGRDAVELPVADHAELALALARKWGRLTPDQKEGMMRILREGDQ